MKCKSGESNLSLYAHNTTFGEGMRWGWGWGGKYELSHAGSAVAEGAGQSAPEDSGHFVHTHF